VCVWPWLRKGIVVMLNMYQHWLPSLQNDA